MLEQLQGVLSLLNPPPNAHVGEAFMLTQSLSAYYYLRCKSTLFAHHCQSPELKAWWKQAEEIIGKRIDSHVELMTKLGIPLPPSVPVTNELSDQLMATDGMAMVKGMINADAIALQTANRPDVAMLYHQMFNSTLVFGAKLLPIMESAGWLYVPPTYSTESAKQ
jgi:hypothetical protein